MVQTAPPSLFSPRRRRLRLERAARNFSQHDFLHRRVAEDALDRLETMERTFENALFFGPGGPLLAETLTPKAAVRHVTFAGESGDFLQAQNIPHPTECYASALPFTDGTFDLVVSLMSLHWENDLPKALLEARRVLKPDGLFIGSFPAERTLAPFRAALRDAEAAETGGVAPRVAPFVAIKDAGSLLQRAGLALPVVDLQPVTVRYKEPYRLIEDLRGMGETLALASPSPPLSPQILARALARIAGEELTFDIAVLTAWAPHPDQPKPLKPGSGKMSLADAIRKGQSD